MKFISVCNLILFIITTITCVEGKLFSIAPSDKDHIDVNNTNLNSNNLSKEESIHKKLFGTNYQNRCINKKPIINTNTVSQNGEEIILPKINFNNKKKYLNNRGFGEVAYLFDFLDGEFLEDITNEFESVWQEANKLSYNHEFNDVYDINKLLAYSNIKIFGNHGLDLKLDSKKMTPLEIQSMMRKIIPSFDYSVYSSSLSIKQINSVIINWGYIGVNYDLSKSREIVDEFDLDGDGRLNRKEFILFTIVKNPHILKNTHCTNCYLKFISEILNPIYNYLDCTEDGVLTTEEICNGFMMLNRKNPDNYNMFKCNIDDSVYRTTSCNDLILKNREAYEGGLNRIEFMIGILLGFWDRQVSRSVIYNDDKRNKKYERWLDKGKVDKVCEKLLKYQKN